MKYYTRRKRSGLIKEARLKKAIGFALVAALLFLTLLMRLSYIIHAHDYNTTIKHTVQSGETLWGIASYYSTDRQDIRRVISEIETINECSAVLFPGETLEIPVYIN